MSESKFKNLQEDVCYKEPEEIEKEEALDKICPTCIPNPNYFEPDWTQSDEPYLNEATCEYQVKAVINFDGDIYYDKNVRLMTSTAVTDTLAGAEAERRSFRRIYDSPYEPSALLKSYIRPAVRRMLRHFGKLETDEIVCASPPQGPGQICKGIFGLDYEKHIQLSEFSTDELEPSKFAVQKVDEEAIQSEFEDITNTGALEIYARVKDYSFITSTKILIVHIAVPAYKFDSIPDAPDLGSLNTSTDKIVITPPEFMDTIDKFDNAMLTFSKFQSYFYKEENGSLYFEKTGDPFYLKFYAEVRIKKFVDSLNALMEKNGFNLKGVLGAGEKHPDIAFEIEISFDKSDESKPFVVQNVRARKKGCPFIECKNGLPTFIKHSRDDQTMMGYISDIKNIGRELQSNKTPPWLDFIVSKTFPQLAVNYGSSGKFADNACLSANLQDAYDFLLEEAMDLFTAIEYAFNKNRCKTKQEILEDRKKTTDYFSNSPEAIKRKKELAEAWTKRQEQGEKIYEAAEAGVNAGVKGARKFKKDPKKSLIDLGNSVKAGTMSAGEAIKKFIQQFNACDFKHMLNVAMKCLMAGLSLDEVYYTILKQILSSAGEAAIQTVLETLPADKRQAIEETIRKEFGDMPFPWEPGWESGSLGSAVDRQAIKNSESDEIQQADAESDTASLKERIRKLLEDKQSLLSFLEFGGREDPEFQQILKDIDSKRQENIIIDQDIGRINETIKEFEGYIEAEDPADLDEEELAQQDANDEAFRNLIKREKERREIKLQELDLNIKKIKELEKFITYESSYALGEGQTEDVGGYATDVFVAQEIATLAFPSQVYIDFVKKELKRIEKLIEKLEKKQSKKEKVAEELEDYKFFASLSPEDKEKAIELQKQKTILVSLTPSDEIVEGTLGRALGNVQKAMTQVFIEEILKNATIIEIQKAIENIPGAGLLIKLITRFKCGSDPLFYPPFESFLSTLTFDPCGPEKTRISLPELQDPDPRFNWIEQLMAAFNKALREVASRAMMAIIIKTTEVLNTELCRLAGNLTRAGLDGGLEGVIDEILCPDLKQNRPDETTDARQKRLNKIEERKRLEDTHESILSAGGAGGRSASSNSSLVRLLSVSATQGEIKKAMVGKKDEIFLNNISSLVKAATPEFADVFADSESTAQFFLQMGNLLTSEQRSAIFEQEEAEFDQYPVENSICLTREEKDDWDRQRQAAFSDPDLGEEFVNKQNEKTKSDLADAANLLINGPEETLQRVLDEAFNPKDPDCKTNKGLVPTFQDFPPAQKQTISNAITGIFKNLERAFLNDTIEQNPFGSIFLGDTPGILITILSNKKSWNLGWHMLVQNNFFFKFIFGDPGEFPDTVAGALRDSIINPTQRFNYLAGMDYKILFSNKKTDNAKFTSMISYNDSQDSEGRIRFSDSWSGINFLADNLLEIKPEFQPDSFDVLDFSTPFGAMTLGKMIEHQWQGFGANFSKEDLFLFYNGMNSDILEKIPERFTERQVGTPSEGYLFGNANQPILEDSDLVYVGPNGEEPYEDNFSEEDAVLGRSKTNNPRVHFLDPNKYGGTYMKPKIYIAEGAHEGWMAFSKIVVPNPTGCDPKNSNFLMLDSLMKQMEKNESRIQNHENLKYDPACTIELPFDKVSDSNTLATLEGIVRATVRVYLSDFLIRTFPIFSNIHLDVEKNYDNILLTYIVENIYRGLVNEKAIFASTYEGYTYSLIFLEQVVQIVSRRVKNGEMETNEEIEEVLQKCTDVQENFPIIMEKDEKFFKLVKSYDNTTEFIQDGGNLIGKRLAYYKIIKSQIDSMPPEYVQKLRSYITQIESGAAILRGVKDEGFDLLSFFANAFLQMDSMSLQQMRFAAKINSIHSVVFHIKKLLKYIVKEELDVYTEKMREQLEPRPWIYDIRKFFIGGSKMMYGKQTETGVFDAEIPIGGGVGSLPYGDVNDCARKNMNHPLNGTSVTQERFNELKQRGGFYLEKYVISSPKENSRLFNPNVDGKGLMSVQEFKSFLTQNALIFTAGDNISDYFGDAELDVDGRGFEGSIGVKFGVRLCYMPPEGFQLSLDITEAQRKGKENRSYYLNPASFSVDGQYNSVFESSRFSFPICSYEQDITDVKLVDLLNSNGNLDQDLKCYIDKLVETDNYKHLVDNVLQIKKLPSIYMVYSYVNLIPSLGTGDERDEPGEDDIKSDDIGKLFNNSKSEARKLFVSFYKNNDRDPPDEEEEGEDLVGLAQRRLLNLLRSINLGEFSWDIRRRMVKQNPFDKDGNECKNNFGKLFTIKER